MVIVFKNEEQKKESIIEALKSLKENIGWQVIMRAIDENIKETEAKLNGEIDLESDENTKQLQDKRKDRIRLRNLPEELIEEYREKEGFPPELDPYA